MTNFRLSAFGGLSLFRDGVEVAELANQRKALTLLAVLAASGPRGIPREKLTTLFWPERDTEHARGALKQMLHALRRQLGCTGAIVGVAELRLDPGWIASDVASFRDALAAGDDAGAVREWTGPFLDGVYVEGSSAFDQWVEGERSSFNRQYGEALERLADEGERAGKPSDAARLWASRHEFDRFHAPTSVRLMRALDAAGDRAGALRHAMAHEILMREELDAPADPAVQRLAEALRSADSSPPTAPHAESNAATSRGLSSDHGDVPTAVVAAPAAAASPRKASRTMLGVALLAVTCLVVFWSVRGRKHLQAVGATPVVPNRVAVAVFINRTGSREYDALGTMASDWVTRGVARTPGVELFDIGGLYLEGRTPSGSPTDPRALARANGAGIVVAGNYYVVDGQLAFSVQILDVLTGRVLRVLDPVTGAVNAPLVVVEEVRQRVASGLGMLFDPRASQLSTAAMVPPRYDAYVEFAAAQEIYWRGDWESALPHFRKAASLDSNFFTALVFVGIAGVGTGRCPLVDSVHQVLSRRRAVVPQFDWLSSQVSVARCASDHDTHNRLHRERAALVPGSRMIQLILSTGFRQLNRPGEALAILAEINPARDLGWLPMRGRSFYWREVASNQHLLRDFRAERGTAERMQSAGASPLAIGLIRARSLAALGFGDSALAVLAGLGDTPGDPALVSGVSGRQNAVQTATAGWVMSEVAFELAAHGDSTRSIKAMQQAVAWFNSVERTQPLSPAAALTFVQSLEFLGRVREAQTRLTTLVTRDSANVDLRGTLGVLAARAHDSTTAHRVFDWLGTVPPAFPLGLPLLYRAEIAAVLGDSVSALAILRALPHAAHPLDVMHFHVDPAMASLRGTATMQRWLVPRG